MSNTIKNPEIILNSIVMSMLGLQILQLLTLIINVSLSLSLSVPIYHFPFTYYDSILILLFSNKVFFSVGGGGGVDRGFKISLSYFFFSFKKNEIIQSIFN